MVYQIPNNVIDIKVCSLTFQRHCHSEINRRNKTNNNTLYKKPKMADSLDRQTLPVVELRPFSKKVWRREKSLPDFYDNKRPEELKPSSNPIVLENSPTTSRLVRDLTETRRSIESRQNTFDSALGKYRSHPKAEFLHESTRAWRKQDLIPSFITRSERTKTSLDFMSRDNTLHPINLDKTALFDNVLKCENNSAIKINGDRMNQQVHRRHLLYLNPLDTCRQPNSWVPHFNSSNPSRQNSSRDKYFSARHSFPLTSRKTRDLVLGESQAHYALKPIRREDAESPHKFNSKLGAAKNSLDVLSRIGNQTKLEKNLEEEMEQNLEKFRKDRLTLSSDFKGLNFHCLNFEANLTVGEMSLKNAREANKAGKDKQRQINRKRTNLLSGDMRDNGYYSSSYDNDVSTPRLLNTSVINPVLHPIGHPLVEEAEARSVIEPNGTDPRKVGESDKGQVRHVDNGMKAITFQDQIQTDMTDGVEKSRQGDIKPTRIRQLEPNREESHSSQNDPNNIKGQNDPNNIKGQNDPNNMKATPIGIADSAADTNKTETNNNGIRTHVIDSSRIETNVAYLENLQFKSSPGYISPRNTTGQNLTRNEARLGQNGTQDDKSNGQQLQAASQQSQYTSNPGASPSQQNLLISPNGASNSSPNQANNTNQNTTPMQNGAAPQQSQSISQDPNIKSMQDESQPLQQPQATDELKANQDSASVKSFVNNAQPSITDSTEDKFEKQSEGIVVDETNKPVIIELINTSPMTSSGFESQPTTDQEDILSPGSDDRFNGTKNRNEKSRDYKDDAGDGNASTSEPAQSVSNEGDITPSPRTDQNGTSMDTRVNTERGSDDSAHIKTNRSNTNGDNDNVCDGREINKLKNNVSASPLTMGKRVPQYSPLEDEGISLVTTEAVVLDSSTTEVCSDHEGPTGCRDNGDSGVSTTFMTSEESVPGVLEGIMMS